MEIEKSIQIYNVLFFICIGITVIGFGLAVLIFFKYKILTVFALQRGRTKIKANVIGPVETERLAKGKFKITQDIIVTHSGG